MNAPNCCLILTLAAAALSASTTLAQTVSRRSTPIAEVLRQPLPAENLKLQETESEIIIHGPTFTYAIDRRTGLIARLAVHRDGAEVLTAATPLRLRLDAYKLTADGVTATTKVASADAGKVVLSTTGELKGAPPLPFTLETSFFSDGVVVGRFTIMPHADLAITEAIEYAADLEGRLERFFHKCHERYDSDTGGEMPPLPAVGAEVEMTTTTSCLQAMSHEAAAAIFTDLGAYHKSEGATTASIESRAPTNQGHARVVLKQFIAHIAEGGQPLQLPAGQSFTFRIGLSVAPQRLPHPRSAELRHFTWIGDDKNPYPTNEEIDEVARLGFNLFQIHRLGLLGQPRPPRGELERVIARVHEHGMLLILLTLPDLLDAHSPRLQQMRADGIWPQWEAHNYGGRYTAAMDSYVDYYGTCVGAPNGLDDYHLEVAAELVNRFDVDGIYLDDNITQGPSCPHWQLHGHPRPGYDCLIEMHEVNWRRRRFLLEHIPHLVLVDHCTIGLWLPLLAPFDVHLYGEGHGISALDAYWNFYGMVKSMNAQGHLWPGGLDGARFATPGAYVLDLLTGGGQYCYIDWRLFTNKFTYAAGVLGNEKTLVKAFNLAQHYFGMHEATPLVFAHAKEIISGANPATRAAVYRNRTWNDLLLIVANSSQEPVTDSLSLHQPKKLDLDPKTKYGVFDIFARRYGEAPGSELSASLKDMSLAADATRIFYLRQTVDDRPQHVWGGKRVEEVWDPATQRLSVFLSAPQGVTDTVFLRPGPRPISSITVDGRPAIFKSAPDGLLHGEVTFRHEPILLEIEVGELALVFPSADATPLEPYATAN